MLNNVNNVNIVKCYIMISYFQETKSFLKKCVYTKIKKNSKKILI